MKIILIISILLNIILIYNLGKYKQTINRKDRFINNFISKEKILARELNKNCILKEDCFNLLKMDDEIKSIFKKGSECKLIRILNNSNSYESDNDKCIIEINNLRIVTYLKYLDINKEG